MSVLAGVKVIELGGLGPGPFCAMMLADMGADVVLIDRRQPGSFDPAVDLLNRGKRSVALDLKRPEAVAVLLEMIDRADMLIDPFRPGVAERLGIGPDVCLERNPRIVYGRVTGWGQTGPLAQSAGHDLNYIAVTGALDSIGTCDSPVPPLNLVGDYAGGALYLMTGLLAAYSSVLKTEQGQVVDAAMFEGVANMMTGTFAYHHQGRWSLGRGANFIDGSAPDYTVYRCADGGFITITAMEAPFFQDLLQRLGPAAAGLSERGDNLRSQLAAIFATRSRNEWCVILEGTDSCFAPVLSIAEAPFHPQAVAREAFVDPGNIIQPAPAPRFSRTPSTVVRSPPAAGADMGQCLLDWGVSDAAIEALQT